MPTYVYKNLATGERFEIEQRITDSPLEAHPETGEPVKRLVQPVGIAFKGSGFYATDSRASGTPAKSATDGSADKSGSSDGGTSSSKETKAKETSGAKASSSTDG